jgi:hypothetical protein
MAQYHKANLLLENGILAELDGKKDPQLFRDSLVLYQKMAKSFDKLIAAQIELITIDAKMKESSGMSVKTYDEALSRVLSELGPLEVPTAQGSRYALVSGKGRAKSIQLMTMGDILRTQLLSMQVLQRKSRAAIDAMRSAIPLAEKGKFVPVMLSGRNAFGDLMPQYTDLVSVFDRLYTKTCMATISATMQAYPAGWQWLESP